MRFGISGIGWIHIWTLISNLWNVADNGMVCVVGVCLMERVPVRCVDYLVSEGVVKVVVMRLCLAQTVVELRGRTDNYDSVDDVCMLLQLSCSCVFCHMLISLSSKIRR